MKYKLINYNTKEEIFCDKVVIDGFDYYLNDDEIKQGDYCYQPHWDQIVKCPNDSISISQHNTDLKEFGGGKAIATNNPNIGLPQVVELVDKLAEEHLDVNGAKWSNNNDEAGDNYGSFKSGYNKSQQLHPYSIDDMLEFANWYKVNDIESNSEQFAGYTDKDVFDYWEEQRIKTVYYG